MGRLSSGSNLIGSTILVLAVNIAAGQATSCVKGEGGTCLQEYDQTSLMQVKSIVQHGPDRIDEDEEPQEPSLPAPDSDQKIVNAGITAQSGKFCWSPTKGRGVGKIPNKCNKGYSMKQIAGIIPACVKDQYKKPCPQGWKDLGLFCKNSGHTDCALPYNTEGKCKVLNSRLGCAQMGLMKKWYAKCKPGYHRAVTMCTCLPDGMSDEKCVKLLGNGSYLFGGSSCAKPISNLNLDIDWKACPEGTELDAGLCYKKCQGGAKGVGPVCWYQPPKGWIRCGMGAAKDKVTCGVIVSDQMFSVAAMALKLGTMGGATPAIEGVNLAKTIVTEAQPIVTNIAKTWEAIKIAKATQNPTNLGAVVEANLGGTSFITGINDLLEGGDIESQIRGAAKITAMFDPTGGSKVVASYAFPICGASLAPAIGKKQRDAAKAGVEQVKQATGIAKARDTVKEGAKKVFGVFDKMHIH